MATDIGSFLMLGIVVVGGLVLLKYGPGWLASIQAGGTPGGDGTGLGGDGTGLGGDGTGTGVDCSQTPNDPSCQLSASGDFLGQGTNSNSTILKDINRYYNSQCVQANGCGPLNTSLLKKAGLQHLYQDAFRRASSFRRGSAAYDGAINDLVKVVAQLSCTRCYAALGGTATGMGTKGGCIQPSQLTNAQYSGSCTNVCNSSCSTGYSNCFLGHDNNGMRHAFCQCNQNSCATLKNLWNMSLGIPATGGGGTGGLHCPSSCACICVNGKPVCKGNSGCPCVGNCTPSHGTGSGGHTPTPFACSPSTGACSTSGQQTCFHICDTNKKKNCVRCDTSPPLIPPPSCATVKAHVGSKGC